MTQTDKTARTGTRGAETAAPGEVQEAELPEDRQGQEDIDDIDGTSSSPNWAFHG
jgi:hypothetical protein